MIYRCGNAQCVNNGVLVESWTTAQGCRYCGTSMVPSYALQQPAQLMTPGEPATWVAGRTLQDVDANVDNVRQELMQMRRQFDQLVTYNAAQELITTKVEPFVTSEFVDPIINAFDARLTTLERRIDSGDVTF